MGAAGAMLSPLTPIVCWTPSPQGPWAGSIVGIDLVNAGPIFGHFAAIDRGFKSEIRTELIRGFN